MITNFFKQQFSRHNIDNRKTRVYIPSLFIGYIVLVFIIGILLKKLFPFTPLINIENDNSTEINLISTTIFLVFGAIMEEFKYRGLLTKFSYKWVLISISVFLASVIFLILDVKVYYLHPESMLPMFGYMAMFAIASVFLYMFFFKTLLGYRDQMKVIFDRNFYLILWLQIIVFGLWHVFFSGQSNDMHYISVFIGTCFSALFYSFIRVNYGILYSIIVHFMHNFMITIFPLLLVEIPS